MPELPEVETIVRDLRPWLIGRAILGVQCGSRPLRVPWQKPWGQAIAGQTIRGLSRRGKWIVIELDRGTLLIHLGMTGQLQVASANTPRPDHLHLVFHLDNGEELRFRDIRRFGSARWLPGQHSLQAFFTQAGLGPEPFDLTADGFRHAVQRSQRTIKSILLDQRVVAGIGNIYADEACFRSGIHPARRGQGLTAGEVERLRLALGEVIREAIDCRGSTIRNYVGGSGLRGEYQEEFQVYGRTGQPCRTCGKRIRRMVIAGRSSHYCPVCQRPPTKRGQAATPLDRPARRKRRLSPPDSP